MSYETRIVSTGKNCYFVDYRWAGNKWYGLLTNKDIFWRRWSMVPNSTIEEARKTAKIALASHALNYSWNTKVVES